MPFAARLVDVREGLPTPAPEAVVSGYSGVSEALSLDHRGGGYFCHV